MIQHCLQASCNGSMQAIVQMCLSCNVKESGLAPLITLTASPLQVAHAMPIAQRVDRKLESCSKEGHAASERTPSHLAQHLGHHAAFRSATTAGQVLLPQAR